MMSIRTMSTSGFARSVLDARPCRSRRRRPPCRVASSTRGEREDVAHVVVDDQHLLALEHRLGAVQLLEHAPLRLRQPRLDAVEEERRLVEQPLRRARVLDDDRLGVLLEPRLLAARQLLARVDDHRQRRVARSSLLQPARAARSRVISGSFRSSTMQSNCRVLERLERLARSSRRRSPRRPRRRRSSSTIALR